MIDTFETFNGTWPFKPNFCSAAGFKQHYIDEGPREGEVLICLHGEPTWGYLYRKMIPKLSDFYRVIVPDHMGFGKSETPTDRIYSLKSHVDNLASLINSLGLKNITFIVQDWGGPISAAYAIRNPKNVKRFCLLNTLFGYGGPPMIKKRSPWFQWVAVHEEAGTLEGILGEMGSTLLSVMKIMGFENSKNINQHWLDAYTRPFPNRAACVGAIEFPLDIHYKRNIDYIKEGLKLGNLEQLKSKPAMLAEGMRDKAILPENAIADFRALWPQGPINTFPEAGHFCQEDIPDNLTGLIHQFVQMTR